MTDVEAMVLLKILEAAYPGRELDEPTIDLYCAMLQDLPFDAACRAILEIVAGSTSRFFPTIGEIRRAVAEARAGLPGVEQAWLEVQREVRAKGQYEAPTFSHPLIGQAVDAIGGWWALCTSDEPSAKAAQFRRVYEALREEALRSFQLAIVPAIEDAMRSGPPALPHDPKVVRLPQVPKGRSGKAPRPGGRRPC